MIKSKTTRLFLVSFSILFFELILLRYIPAQINHVGFFSNLILLACFLGIGLGILLSRKNICLLPAFPVLLLASIVLLYTYHLSTNINISGVIYFQAATIDKQWLSYLVVFPSIFASVTLLMTLLSSELGSLLRSDKPLKVYFIDIMGSLFGIVAFSFCSWYYLPPIMWFLILFIAILFLHPKSKWLISSLLCSIAVLIVVHKYNFQDIWSHYYKISVVTEKENEKYHILTNNTNHQHLATKEYLRKDNFYTIPYQFLAPKKFEDVLIIGAGSGNDVTMAIEHGAKVDAVEIDEVIRDIGIRLHPEKPYKSNNVNVFIQDGRTFISNTDKKYDMVIYALTDSLILQSAFSNLRLESYLYTIESLLQARSLLKEDGVLVLYNYYREVWLVEKIAWMMKETFGKNPAVLKYEFLHGAAIIGAENLQQYPQLQNYIFAPKTHTVASDDWPFLYMKEPSLPFEYIRFVIIFIAISILAIMLTTKIVLSKGETWFSWHFFFLGAAFLLLETKCIITFSLLFGSTWAVNSIVFFIILSLVLLAIMVQMQWKIKNYKVWYIALFIVIVLNYFVPLSTFSFANPWIKGITAGVFYLCPIFLANIIFAQSFQNTEKADMCFSANLLGAMIGGFLEYLAMLFGYNALMIVVLALYLLAFTSRRNR